MSQLLACALLTLSLLTPYPRSEQDAPKSDASTEAVAYDVADLVRIEGDGRMGEASEAEVVEQVVETLTRLLKSFGPLAEGEVVFTTSRQDVVQPQVMVVASPATHAWIRDWLALQRSGGMLEVQARFLQAPRGHFAALGIGPGGGVEPEQLERILAALQGEEIELLSAPRVRIRSASRAQLTVLEEVSYIKDWRVVVVEPGGREIADPIIDTLADGVRLEVLGTLLPDGTLGLELVVSHSKLKRPIETRQVRLRPGSEATVEVGLPELDTVSVDTRVVLADGAAILLGTIAHEAGRETAVLIEARVVRPRIEPGADEPR